MAQIDTEQRFTIPAKYMAIMVEDPYVQSLEEQVKRLAKKNRNMRCELRRLNRAQKAMCDGVKLARRYQEENKMPLRYVVGDGT